MKPETEVIHNSTHESIYGEVSVPIFQSSTFSFPSVEEGAARFDGKDGMIYSRLGNPTVSALETAIASLEHGHKGIACSSGMGAISATLVSCLKSNDTIIVSSPVYGCTHKLISNVLQKLGINSEFVDSSNINNVMNVKSKDVAAIFIETPSNPTMSITDIRRVSKYVHGRWSNCLVIVDNTFCSPLIQRPLEMGADVVVHSLTKFVNGHSDVLGGMIVVKDEETYKMIHGVSYLLGATMDPHQAWLILRGLQTLDLRLERSQKNAMILANLLESNDKVGFVWYPGLRSFPQYYLVKEQMLGFGSMISFELKGGLEAGKLFMNSLKLITRAVSLGGVESLIQHPASMTHVSVPKDERLKYGITDGLIRLSVGCENINDILEDIDQALDKI